MNKQLFILTLLFTLTCPVIQSADQSLSINTISAKRKRTDPSEGQNHSFPKQKKHKAAPAAQQEEVCHICQAPGPFTADTGFPPECSQHLFIHLECLAQLPNQPHHTCPICQSINIWTAIASGDLSWVRNFIDHHGSLTCRDKFGWTPLHTAASRNNRVMLTMLLDAAPVEIIHATNQADDTALHISALHGLPENTTLLLNRGSNVAALNRKRWTVLDHAVQSGNILTVEIVLNKAKPDPLALLFAINKRHYQAVSLLLNKNAEINNTINGLTPLHWAVINDDPVITLLLIARGADANARDSRGRIPAYYAKTPQTQALFPREQIYAH